LTLDSIGPEYDEEARERWGGTAEFEESLRRTRSYGERGFYECTAQVHRGLGEMYVADPRFSKNWDRHAPGLAPYVRDAILAA
jgi:MerR family transcriptional regulator, thiopeptide resistance regulator